MTKVISVVAGSTALNGLVGRLRAMAGVEPSEITDWSGQTTALDAPFNPGEHGATVALVHVLVEEEASAELSAAVAAVADARLLASDGVELTEVRSADDVMRAVEQAPEVD